MSTFNFGTPSTTGFTFGTSTPTTGFTLGTLAPSTTSTTTSSTGFTFGAASTPLATASTAQATLTTTTPQASTASQVKLGGQQPAGTFPSGLSFSELEDLINKWSVELGEQEKVFLNQATQINAWDNLLAVNCDKLASLDEAMSRVKAEQKKINHDLDFIHAQQKELEASLAPLEKDIGSPTAYTNDVQRQRLYFMAENIDSQLKRMSEDLKETIEHINETSRSKETVDPVIQIGRILNAHMNSLQWIDDNTNKLQTQIEVVSKLQDSLKRETQRQSFY